MEKLKYQVQAENNISESERSGFYKVLQNRRDVRGQFLPKPVPEDVLSRVLKAAHQAPSVGFMQPWNFTIIKSPTVKKEVFQAFRKANEEASKLFTEKKGNLYSKLKLEGILDAPLNICVTCDRQRTGKHVLGRTHDPSMDLYSTVCAVQNFWLASRAEGLGLGWVSIFKEKELNKILNIPDDIVPIAYLCLGYVSHFYKSPELENVGWGKRLQLEDLVFYDQWQNTKPEGFSLLPDLLKENKELT